MKISRYSGEIRNPDVLARCGIPDSEFPLSPEGRKWIIMMIKEKLNCRPHLHIKNEQT